MHARMFALDVSVDASSVVAPFAVVRIAAFPLATVERLAPPAFVEACTRWAAAEALRRETRSAAIEELSSALEAVDEVARKEIMNLRRAIVAGRGVAHAASRLAQSSSLALWANGEGVEPYRVATDEATSAALVMDHLFDDAVREARATLRATVKGERFRGCVRAASHRVIAEFDRVGLRDDAAPASKLERTLLGYVQRAAAKTSPFGGFLHHAIVDSRGSVIASPAWAGADRREWTSCNRSIASALLDRAADESLIDLRLATSMNDAPTTRALVSETHGYAGRRFRSDREARFRLEPRLTRALSSLAPTFRLRDVVVALRAEGLSDELAAKTANRLRAAGLLPTCAAWDVFDDDIEARLVAVIRCDPAAAGTAVSTAAERIAEAAETHTFASKEASLETLVDAALEGPGATPIRPIAFADGYFEASSASIPATFAPLFGEVADALAKLTVWRASYLWMVEQFVARWGNGGVCHDVVAFFVALSDACKTHGATLWGPGAPVVPAPKGARVPVTVLVQVAPAHEIGAPSDDDGHVIVVNQVHPAAGWLAARHTAGGGAFHAALAAASSAWLGDVAGVLEPVDVPICGDCNSLQAHRPLTKRFLRWPTEPSLRAGAIEATETSLAHDPRTGLLCLRDAAGAAILPIYLGGILPFPTWGAKYWLPVLGTPFETRRPSPFHLPPPESTIEQRARFTHGRVILQREGWWIPTDYLRKTWFCAKGAERTRIIAADALRRGIPRGVYARAQGHTSLSADGHKPVWIDLMNPLFLDLLQSVARSTPWVVLTEALPRSSFAHVDGEPHAAEFLIELILSAAGPDVLFASMSRGELGRPR